MAKVQALMEAPSALQQANRKPERACRPALWREPALKSRRTTHQDSSLPHSDTVTLGRNFSTHEASRRQIACKWEPMIAKEEKNLIVPGESVQLIFTIDSIG